MAFLSAAQQRLHQRRKEQEANRTGPSPDLDT
jgi:hypothetical protein